MRPPPPKTQSGPTPISIRHRAHLGAPAEEQRSLRNEARVNRVFATMTAVVSVLHIVTYTRSPLGIVDRIGLGVGIAALLLAVPAIWSGSRRWLLPLTLILLSEAVVFLLYLIEAPLPFPNRRLLIATAALYPGLLVLFTGVLRSTERMAVAVSAVGVTLLVLALEGGASWLLSRTPLPLPLDAADRVDVFGFPDVAEELVEVGMVPTPETETTSRYPDNPRGYFRTPDADWDLIMQPSSSGRVVVEDGGVAAYIDRADDPTSWHIQLTRGGISLVGGVEYLLRYRIRASSPREYTVAVSMAHDPWEGLGIYQGAAAGTEWESVLEPFTATVTDDLARFQMDLGGDTADVFVTDLEVTMRDGTPASLENVVDYEWNSRSCRGPDHDADPDPGTFRILALGDSYTAGVGVYFEDVFTSVMQRLLDERASQSDGDQRYEVVNCGVNGFGTREARLFYERRAAAYQPNLVLLVMVANDDRSYAEDITERFVHTPAKWEHLSYAGYYLQAMRFRRPEPDFTDAMLALAELHGAVVDDDAELAVVLFTNTNGREWDLLAERAGTTTDALDVPLLDLREALSAEEPSALMVHPSDGHPNEIAHRIAGETIVEWLDGEGLLRED